MVLQYLSNAGCEGAKRNSIYVYLKFRRKALYFRRKISQSVETISVTSNFDGYSEVNQLKKRSPAFWRPFLVYKLRTLALNRKETSRTLRKQLRKLPL